MKNQKLIFALLLVMFLLAACSTEDEKQKLDVTKLEGEYLGESFPYGEVELFLDGLIDEKHSLQNLVFSPDGKEFYYTQTTIDNDSATIFSSELTSKGWSKPQPLPFIDEYSYTDPFVTYDNSRLFFTSDRPTPREGEHYFDFNIWYVERSGTGWGNPKYLFEINSMEDEYFPSLTENGTIYFSSARDGAKGYWDIYKADYIDQTYEQPVRLPAPINGSSRDFDPFITRDGKTLYFASERSEGAGGGDIYYSEKVDESWGEPVNIGSKINTNDFEFCPRISYDDNFLFFTRIIASEDDFYQEKAPDTRDPFEYIYLPDYGISRVYWIAVDSLKTITP